MPLTVSGTITSPKALELAIVRFGRRTIANALFQQGKRAIQIGERIASERLGPPRVGNRTRDHGVAFHRGFDVQYTDVNEFGRGNMTVSVRNRSKHARVLEKGSRAHTIAPNKKKVLAWPAAPYATPGPPWQHIGPEPVGHPGTRGYKIIEDTAREAIMGNLGGRVLGHLTITVRAGGIR